MNKKQEVYIGFNSQFSKTTGFSNTYIAQEVKELTDEEILEVWRENERVYPLDRSRLLDRTRACIRKAQEK
jgi:hypothetical protein